MRLNPILPLVLALAACSGGSGTSNPIPHAGPTGKQKHPGGVIQHIVFIIQENRSVDNLFQFFPGANTQSFGMAGTTRVQLQPENLVTTCDIYHEHADFTVAYGGGSMSGWNGEQTPAGCPNNAPYVYVPQSQVQPYYTMGEQFVFADNAFQTNQGPSFPAHQYALSGTSAIGPQVCLGGQPCPQGKAAENPDDRSQSRSGGCDSPTDSTVKVISASGSENLSVYPCFTHPSIITELDAAHISWHYYQNTSGPGLWNGVDALRPIWDNKAEYNANVVVPETQVLTDVANGNLAAVTWVTPSAADSDHPKENDGTGPDWVTSVVNAIGQSQYWDSTAIFVLWDDWGGFYDHVTPPIYNSYEDGFRVPLIIISPYSLNGYVSHTPRDLYGSLLYYTEQTFGLPSLGTSDTRGDNFADAFNYNQAPTPFVPIQPSNKKHTKHFFLTRPPDTRPIDD